MCGIAGIVLREPAVSDLPGTLRQLQVALHHRGPDGQGLYLSPDRRAGLVHTRLAILDLSQAGQQPMASPDGRFHITFNGEIYNFRELRRELAAAGEVFETQTDTEVLLRSYQREGPDCVRRFAGMFAFAIWDEREKTCFLARGPLGVKPLYYCLSQERLAFASELRALIKAGLTSQRLAPLALEGYFLFGSVPEPETIVDGVRVLPAGSWLLWRDGECQERRYYEIQFQSEPPPDLDPVAATRAALEESVRRHFVSDVPVGIFLSGGIDSTALVALARFIGIKHIHTFSISFDTAAYDEGGVAARTAKHFETEHHDWRLGADEGKDALNDFVARLDQPSVDGFNTYCVSKWAHDCGAKVVLSGLGGDELFGGYPSFARIPTLVKLGKWLGLSPGARYLACWALQHCSRHPRGRRLGSYLDGQPDLGAAYWAFRGIFTPGETQQLMNTYFDSSWKPDADLSRLHARVPTQPTLADTVSYLEITRYMRNQLLRDSDVMSMAWGLELRVPFVDVRLVETLAGIPAAHRLRAGKQLLLEAVPEIPDWVRNRPKQGFTFPFDQWIAREWQDVFAKLDATCPVRLQTWSRRWALLALEKFVEQNDLKP